MVRARWSRTNKGGNNMDNLNLNSNSNSEASPPPNLAPKANLLAEACARARGESPIPGDEPAAGKWTVAKKDYSSRGRCREHWFRMVWRGGWTYVGDRIGGPGGYDFAEAELWLGELVVRHDRGGPVAAVTVVAPASDGDGFALRKCAFTRTRDGNLRITLPDGSVIVRPDPRR
jgi:hypothetical protein